MVTIAPKLIRRLIAPLVVLFALGAALQACTPARYVNKIYGVSAALPFGFTACRSTDMFKIKHIVPIDRIILLIPWSLQGSTCTAYFKDGARYMYLDAIDSEYSLDSAAKIAREDCPYFSSDEHGRVTPMTPPPMPGGFAWSACRVLDKDGSIYEVLFAVRATGRDQERVVYTIDLKTTPADYAADHSAFMRWLQSVRFMPVEMASD